MAAPSVRLPSTKGRIIQSRSEDSIIREIEEMRDKTPGFTGVVTDLGGPTANMYHLKCKDEKIEVRLPPPVLRVSRHLRELGTDHAPLISLYRRRAPSRASSAS